METEPRKIGELRPGDVVAGRYRIGEKLGEGGMGAVYGAEHIELKREVALKVLLPWRVENERVAARFKQEARVAAAIGHPGIVEVFDMGEDDARGQTFIAMELLAGEELKARIRREGRLPLDLVVRVGVELADAVAAAHEHGIIHRDLKPGNVFLVRRGRQNDVVKVLDFGLAKLVEAAGADASITRSDELFGTPLFMSPEQLRNPKNVDGRTDIYAIGVILYEALTGAPPFQADSVPELILKVATQQPAPLAVLRPGLPGELVEVVERAMNKDRTLRYQSATALRDALEACAGATEGEPIDRADSSSPDLRPTRPGTPGAEALAAGDAPRPPAEGPSDLDDVPSVPPSSPRDRAGGPARPGPDPGAPAAVEAPGAPRRGRLAIVVALGLLSLLVVALGGAGVSWLVNDRGRGAPAGALPDDELPTGALASATPDAAAEADGAEAIVTPGGVAPTVRANLLKRTVAFVSYPAGARILVDDVPVCTAPCDAELGEAEAAVTAVLEGYQRASQLVAPPLPGTVEIRLKRLAAGTPPPRTKLRPSPEGGAPPPLLPR